MIWAAVSSRSWFCWLYRASPYLAAKNISQSNFSIDHLVTSLYIVISYCWKRVFAMTSVFSWQNSVSLCPASCCTPGPNLPVILGISWLAPPFVFLSPMMKRTSFSGVSFRRSCRSSWNHSTSASSALLVGEKTCITVILSGLPWKHHSVIFGIVPKYCISDPLLTMRTAPFLLRDCWQQ